MAERTATTWTCDRCGAQDETRQGEQPGQWSSLRLSLPPKAEFDNVLHESAHLCRRCTSEARSFMARQSVEVPA